METISKEGVVMNKSEIFVKVENKKQAEQYKTILKVLGEEVSLKYWIDCYRIEQDKLIFKDNSWIVLGYTYDRKEITIKELIKMLVSEDTKSTNMYKRKYE